MSRKTNIVLIGMPGSGKSTVGRRLARHYGLQFIDGDVLIEQATGMCIQDVVNRMGLRRFAEIEQRVLCSLQTDNAVISTGGSAVYSQEAMHYLGSIGRRLYLKISRATLLRRVNNTDSRGLFKLPSYSLLRLYAERQALYPCYADLTFANDKPLSAVQAHRLYRLLDAND